MLTEVFADKFAQTLAPGVHGGKVKDGIEILMAFCRHERNIFSLFLFWKIQKSTKKCQNHPQITTQIELFQIFI